MMDYSPAFFSPLLPDLQPCRTQYLRVLQQGSRSSQMLPRCDEKGLYKPLQRTYSNFECYFPNGGPDDIYKYPGTYRLISKKNFQNFFRKFCSRNFFREIFFQEILFQTFFLEHFLRRIFFQNELKNIYLNLSFVHGDQ